MSEIGEPAKGAAGMVMALTWTDSANDSDKTLCMASDG